MKKILAVILACLLLSGCTLVIDFGPSTATPPPASGEERTVHYLDVGQADCILLECGGEFMLIDGGNREDGQMVVSYLQQQGIEELDVVVCTHAHEDHVGGLPSVLAVFPTKRVLSPTRTYSSTVFDKFMYYADQQRLTVEIPSPGDAFTLGSAQVTVLGPVKSYAETNDTSIVLRLEFGETSFLFTGDMEVAAENDMLDYWGSRWQPSDVLKVGHHGSETSTGYRFLYEVSPRYAIVSVGEGNTYGHPDKEPMSRLHDADVTTFRTDRLGTVIAVSDGKDITITWENQTANPEDGEFADTLYIGNKNSKKFHLPHCSSLPSEENRVEFQTYDEAIHAGYSPCASCIGK